MATKPKIGATNWKQEVARAKLANKRARRHAANLLQDNLNQSRQVGHLLAELATVLEALMELEEIGRNAKNNG